MTTGQGISRWKKPEMLPLLFFISGFAALIYQVVWQRVLFSTFGIHIEAVTVIVSIFMLGLGLGSLAGGWLQTKLPHRLLECFIAIETGIGLFGLISIPLIHGVSTLARPDSLLSLIAITYTLLAIPTMLMGATLPLLVTYLEKHMGNLGKTVGSLYALNTLGSAAAAFLTVQLLFVVTGQQGAVMVACLCNLLTALLAYVVCRGMAGKPAQVSAGAARPPAGFEISLPKALLLSGCIGFIALSFEIFWFRTLGFMTAGKPQVFAMLLTIFLMGVAMSSLKVKRLCAEGGDLRKFIRNSLSWLAVFAYASLPVVAFISSLHKIGGIIAAYLFVGLLAFLSGGIFPALCHAGIAHRREAQSGVAVSWMYFCNILGATLGSLVTGFFLFDLLSLQQTLLLLFLLAALFAASFWEWRRTRTAFALLAVLGLAVYLQPVLGGGLYEKLQSVSRGGEFIHIVENRSGIITVEAHPEGDIIYGHGAYDGKFSLDPVQDSNGITRAYMVPVLHPNPKRVLDIGLSGGASSRVMTMYEPLEEIVSIEINPGYFEAIRRYPEIAKALTHPKMRLVVDDGRRWLNRNPDEKFDVIMMNALYYWRSNATNLLSRDFLEICKRHLKPGGVVYYNTTGARDNVYTIAHLFKHVVMVDSFVAGSDEPFDMDISDKRKNLLAFQRDDGTKLFDQPDTRPVMERLATRPLVDVASQVRKERDLWLITDDNMASEYKKDSFLSPAAYRAIWGSE